MVLFASRTDAGERLGALLASRGLPVDIVLGLPRGGVVVAAAVAEALARPRARFRRLPCSWPHQTTRNSPSAQLLRAMSSSSMTTR